MVSLLRLKWIDVLVVVSALGMMDEAELDCVRAMGAATAVHPVADTLHGWFARQVLRILDDLRVTHGRLDAPVPIGDDGGTPVLAMTTRTDAGYLTEFAVAAREAGADRVRYCDTIGGDTLKLSADLLAPGGRLASIADGSVIALGGQYCFVRPDAADLLPKVVAAYDAPFATPADKAGARAFPLMIPTSPDAPGAAEGRRVTVVRVEAFQQDPARPIATPTMP